MSWLNVVFVRCHQLVNETAPTPHYGYPSRRYLRSPDGHHRSRPFTQRSLGCDISRRLHCRRLLLHIFDQLRQPGGHNRSNLLRYLQGFNPPVPMFILCQIIGCLLAVGVMRVTHPNSDTPSLLFVCIHNAGRSQWLLSCATTPWDR